MVGTLLLMDGWAEKGEKGGGQIEDRTMRTSLLQDYCQQFLRPLSRIIAPHNASLPVCSLTWENRVSKERLLFEHPSIKKTAHLSAHSDVTDFYAFICFTSLLHWSRRNLEQKQQQAAP